LADFAVPCGYPAKFADLFLRSPREQGRTPAAALAGNVLRVLSPHPPHELQIIEGRTMSLSIFGTESSTKSHNAQGAQNTAASGTYGMWAQILSSTLASGSTGQKPSSADTAALMGFSPKTHERTGATSAAVAKTLLQLQETGSVFGDVDTKRMDSRGVSDQDRQRFAEIFQDAKDNKGFSDPLAYIQSLSNSDIGVIQRIQCLADPSGVTEVSSKEGAINLLLPPEQQVDINNDGMVASGTANLFKFPPPNSPQSVKDAWAETTKDMTPGEIMLASGVFLAQSATANLQYDADGNVTGIGTPGDANYVNIFSDTEGGWSTLLNSLVAQFQEAVERYPEMQKTLDMLTAFSDNLNSAFARQDTPSSETAAADTEAAAAETTASAPTPTVKVINGHSVITAGHSIDNREGVSQIRIVSGKTFTIPPEMQAQIDDETYTNPNLTVVSSTENTAWESGTGSYVSISYTYPGGEFVDPISRPIPGSEAEERAMNRQRVSEYMGIVDMEQQLKDQYGDDVKLAYSYADNSYIMLTPDDLHYDEITAASDGVQTLLSEVRRGYIPRDQVGDILGQYGYTV